MLDTFGTGQYQPGERAVPKSTGISSTPAENAEAAEFVTIALFSGVGALVSLVVLILRIHGIF